MFPSREYEHPRKLVGTTVKVAAGQIDTSTPPKLEKVYDLLESIALSGASLVVFPELCLTGLNKNLSETVPGPSTEALAAKAKELGIFVVVGLLEKHRQKFYNTAVLIGPEGIAGKYRKIHPWYPSEYPVPVEWGDLGYPVFNTNIGKIGMLICYDVWFPEPARILALQGAEIIAVPIKASLRSAFDYILRTRALENHVWIVGANGIAVAEAGGMAWKITGLSQIVSVYGEVLAQAGSEKEETIYADIDVKAATHDKQLLPGAEWEKTDLFWERKPETYHIILNK